MEPNLNRFNNSYKEKQRKKNVKEYQDKFFKNSDKIKKHNKRK